MSCPMSDQSIAQYRRDGFHFPIRVMSVNEARGYRERLEAYEASTGSPLAGDRLFKIHLLFTWAHDLVSCPQILDAVEAFIGPDILCWGTDVFIKEPHDPSFVSWHQDSTYWSLDPSEGVTVWLALSSAPVASGAMKFLPASHTAPIPHIIQRHKDNLLTRGQHLAIDVKESDAVNVALEPGEISLHDFRLAHGSYPNTTDDRRIGLAIRYVPPHIRSLSVRDSAMLVRGKDRFDHFEHEQAPKSDLDPAARAVHTEIVKRLAKVIGT